MAARYVRIGQYPDYRDEVRGTLTEILASTANPGTYAAPEDVAGCTLEMGADGKWVGTLGSLPKATADALYASGALANLATGTPGNVAGALVRYGGAGVGWVSTAPTVAAKSARLLDAQPVVSIGAVGVANSAFYDLLAYAGITHTLYDDSWSLTYSPSTPTYSTPAGASGEIATEITGKEFAIRLSGTGAISVYIQSENGDYGYIASSNTIRLSSTYAAGVMSYVKISFSKRMRRKVFIKFLSGVGVAGIQVEKIATITPIYDTRKRVGWITDSYGSTTTTELIDLYTASMISAMAPNFGDILPLSFSSVMGGTGYVALNPFVDRVPLFSSAKLDYLIIAGGINDSTGTLAAKAGECYAAARIAHPNAVLVVLGAWSPSSIGSSASSKNAILKGALRNTSGSWVFIDSYSGEITSNYGTLRPATVPWIVGDGRSIDITSDLVDATSATMKSNWTAETKTGTLLFSDGTTKSVTFTNNSANISWTGGVTADGTVGMYMTVLGSSSVITSIDGTHPSKLGVSILCAKIAESILAYINRR